MPRRAAERGSMLLLAMGFVLLLAVVGILVLRHAGRDRIAVAQLVSRERALACAEAGLQYGRRFFGLCYEASHGWNDYLDGTTIPGYTYIPSPSTTPPSLSTLPKQVRGASDGTTYDTGTTYNGKPTFWVSVRDDHDEAAAGKTNDLIRDNNEAVIVRSECTAFYYLDGSEERTAALEALLVHVQSASGYANNQLTTNSPDILGLMGSMTCGG